jgi:hypothetical protein
MNPAPVLVPTPAPEADDIREIQALIQQAREIIRIRRAILLGAHKGPAR